MEFTIREYREYRESEILLLYQSAGWRSYTDRPDMLKSAYEHSLKILAAYEREKLIGVIRAVGDGYSIVYIQDLLVMPAYQHQGVGRALLGKILEIYHDVYQKILLTDNAAETIRFYQSAGFSTATDIGCMALVRMN